MCARERGKQCTLSAAFICLVAGYCVLSFVRSFWAGYVFACTWKVAGWGGRQIALLFFYIYMRIMRICLSVGKFEYVCECVF